MSDGNTMWDKIVILFDLEKNRLTEFDVSEIEEAIDRCINMLNFKFGFSKIVTLKNNIKFSNYYNKVDEFINDIKKNINIVSDVDIQFEF